MKSTRFISLVIAIVIIPSIAAAGDLNPPAGPTSGTMKTLDQIRPAVPIGQADIPLTITQPGSYYLTENVTSTSSNGAIYIDADNVTLDLGGFTLTGSGALANYGIRSAAKTNIRIHNGTVTGFVFGIYTDHDSSHHRLTGVRAVANRRIGFQLNGTSHAVIGCTASNNAGIATANGLGIFVGNASLVCDCLVSGNAAGAGGTYSGGIRADTGCTVRNNTVFGNAAGATAAYAAGINASAGCTVIGNTVYDNAGETTGTGISAGIYGSLGIVISDNAVFGNGSNSETTVYGIFASSGCTVKGNTAYRNGLNATGTSYGLYAASRCLVDQNTSYSNAGTDLYTGSTCVLGINCSM